MSAPPCVLRAQLICLAIRLASINRYVPIVFYAPLRPAITPTTTPATPAPLLRPLSGASPLTPCMSHRSPPAPQCHHTLISPPLLRCSPYIRTSALRSTGSPDHELGTFPLSLSTSCVRSTTEQALGIGTDAAVLSSRKYTAKASTTCVDPSPGGAPQDDTRSSVRGDANTSRSARRTGAGAAMDEQVRTPAGHRELCPFHPAVPSTSARRTDPSSAGRGTYPQAEQHAASSTLFSVAAEQ